MVVVLLEVKAEMLHEFTKLTERHDFHSSNALLLRENYVNAASI